MQFIDLFAGLGGFHVGLSNNGHQCVFACEIEPELRQLYWENYGLEPFDDVTKIDVQRVPEHDIICAGFPCQPFSLAGSKKGAECPKSGKLIDYVIKIAKYHSPKFIFLENVPNILSIADGSFWEYLTESFENIGYTVHHKIISPTDIGIPQNRKRVFIVAVRSNFNNGGFDWPDMSENNPTQLVDMLEQSMSSKKLENSKIALLRYWQQLIDKLSIKNMGSISIAAPEFGATYPFDFQNRSLKEMKNYKGAYGQDMSGCITWADILEKLPAYARKERKVANWIIQSVKYSRKLYSENKQICDVWARDINKTNNSWQILEWRGRSDNLSIYEHLVQFRASGIRILRPHVAPSLISMTPTQIPVIPSESRYLSTYEAAKLQNLHQLKRLPPSTVKAFKALGNAVNAKIVEQLTKNIHTI